MSGASRGFSELGRTECPVCGHTDRCKANQAKDRIVCFRVRDEQVGEWTRIKVHDQCCTYALGGRDMEAPAPTLTELAAQLGVSIGSLQTLQFRLHKGKWANPERNAKGEITTLVRRCANGRKIGDKSKPRGMTYAVDWRDHPGPVLVVEGASDVAACLTMGLGAVGRSGAKAGAELLADLLVDRKADVLIVGENDDGDGVAGAELIATKLTRIWYTPVRWALPPPGYKDVRALLQSKSQAGVPPEESGRELQAYLQANARVVNPGKSVNEQSTAIVSDARPTALTTTDYRIAERLVWEHGADLRYCAALGWLRWDGRRWERDETGEVSRRAKRTVRDLQRWAIDNIQDPDERRALIDKALSRETLSKLNSIIGLAATESSVCIRVDQLDSNPWLLNVANGTLNLQTGVLRSHCRDDLLTKFAPVDFDRSASCPLFFSFLDRTFRGDNEMIGHVRRMLGYSLTGVIREHILIVMYGTGANGKSTLILVVQRLMGDYAMMAAPKLLIARQQDQHPTEVADLRGRRFVASVESGEGNRLDEERVKMLTGGDRLKGRYMREDFFEFSPQHKLFLATNHKPVIRGTDLGIWRRLRLWPFVVTIPPEEQDPQLVDKLSAEGPGILSWMVAGCLEWQQSGLGTAESVTVATERYRAESDSLGAFIGEHCVVAPGVCARASELFARYKQWSESAGEAAITQRAFGLALSERGFENKPHGPARQIHWFGVGLLNKAEGRA